MPRFRPPKRQACEAVRRKLALGSPRHTHRGDGRIHGVGTAHAHESALRIFARWLLANGYQDGIAGCTPDQARAFVQERAHHVGQSALDLARQAIRTATGHDPGPVKSVASGLRRLADEPRAYTPAQVDLVLRRQSEGHQLATRLSYRAGLRAHELHTLGTPEEQPRSSRRTWSPGLFQGREGVFYTVVGKGGLVRAVLVPPALHTEVSRLRLPEPRVVTDRGVHYEQRYGLSGGNAWSTSFTRAAKRALGWSAGAHGLRHAYAQERLEELLIIGLAYDDAKAIVAQELGHFRSKVTNSYLR